jgi:hypothetical protein
MPGCTAQPELGKSILRSTHPMKAHTMLSPGSATWSFESYDMCWRKDGCIPGGTGAMSRSDSGRTASIMEQCRAPAVWDRVPGGPPPSSPPRNRSSTLFQVTSVKAYMLPLSRLSSQSHWWWKYAGCSRNNPSTLPWNSSVTYIHKELCAARPVVRHFCFAKYTTF